MNSDKKYEGFLKGLTNGQLQAILTAVMVIVVVASFIEPLAAPLLLGMVLVAPLAIGYAVGMLVDFMDASVDYKVHLSPHAHIVYGVLMATIVGALAKHLATQMPIVPYHPLTNAIFLTIAPKAIFFIWGVLMALLGYYMAWRNFAKK